jgi:hypothetical protein
MKKVLIAGSALLFLACAALVFTASGSAAEKPCGTISYLVGKATVTHQGKVSKLDMDSPIYNNDLVKTQDKSKVEIVPAKATGFSGKIVVAASTSFYFKLGDVAGQPSTTLDLMAGQVGMKVAKIAGSPSAQIKTETVVCGVRGTEFEVVAPSTGSVLVTCDEGRVGVLGVDGDDGEVGPDSPDGPAVERRTGERFKKLAVGVSSLAEFRDKWYGEEIQALRSDPGKALFQFGGFYLRTKPAFEKAYAQLAKSQAFKRWKKEDQTPGFKPNPKSAQTIKDLKELDAPLTAMRKVLVMFERYAYRLEEVKAAIESSGYVDFTVKDGKGNPLLDEDGKAVTAKALLARYDAEKDAMGAKVGEFRYALILHSLRNPSGDTGRPGAVDADSSSGDFFGGDESAEAGEDDFFAQ